MAPSETPFDERTGSSDQSRRDPPRPAGDSSGRGLCLTTVSRTDGSDRGTVHPPEATGMKRMETWLSADLEAFVSLAACR